MALEFDLNKTFDQNTTEFRKHLEGLDPECAKIFFDNEATLLGDGNPARAQAKARKFSPMIYEHIT